MGEESKKNVQVILENCVSNGDEFGEQTMSSKRAHPPMHEMDDAELGLSFDNVKRRKLAESAETTAEAPKEKAETVSTTTVTILGEDSLDALDQEFIDAVDMAEKARIANPVRPLDPKQRQILDAIAQGNSVFLSGPAGTGKSYLLKIIKDEYVKKYGFAAVYVTASTGTAACLLGGVTINSYAGVGFATETIPVLIGKVRNNDDAKFRIERARMLIIDEISMISAELFNKLNEVFKCIRNTRSPFGGVQLVICGDFFQLPPVTEGNSDDGDDRISIVNTFGDDDSDSDDEAEEFCFQSLSWKAIFPGHNNCYLLTKIFRQDDQSLAKILNNIRYGHIDTLQYAALLKCVNRKFDDPKVIPTHLYPHRKTVDNYNTAKMAEIKNPIHSFRAIDTLENCKYQSLLNSNCMAPVVLNLKVGARVMFIRNRFDLGLNNGSQGIVIKFEEIEERSSVPDGTPVVKSVECPVVKFDNGIEMIVRKDAWKVFSGEKLVAKREQFPLILAWAITIHKSQGMTLDYLEVDIKDVFADGQSYVALSRVKNLKGLRLTSYFPLSAISASGKVFRYYKQVEESINKRESR